jgi:uncharacterized repeat protein (TIGR03803 family)
VYELSPPTQKGGAWVEQVLYSFPTAKQGYVPNGDLVFDRAGNLYGATQFGGGKGNTCDSFYQYCGAVFKLSPPKNSGGTWTGSVLHSFAGGIDGANPNGGLVLDSKGVIYGTTVSGGNQSCKYQGEIGCGTAFKLIPPAKKSRRWTERELHVFTGGNDGGEPNAGLVLGAKGALFGIAEGGNGSGGGIVFRLAATKTGQWGETVLYWFSNTGFGAPLAGVILDSSGDLYGTTQGGGEDPHGTVFRLKPASRKTGAWTLKLLSEFAGSPDGAHPESSLVLDNSGNLYGTTLWGGTGTTCQGGCGTVFEVSP